MGLQHGLLLLLFSLHLLAARPFGGWGPGEGFGHASRNRPPDNPNANFGYDFFGTTHGRYNYSEVLMTHSAPASMLDPHHVAVAAEGGGRRGRARAAARLHRLHRTLAARRGKSRRRSRRRKEKKLGVDQATYRNSVTRNQKKPKETVRDELTAGDLWRLNKTSQMFSENFSRKGKRLSHSKRRPRPSGRKGVRWRAAGKKNIRGGEAG